MSDDRSQQAVPDEGAASPRLQDDFARAPHRFIEPESLDALREACTIRTARELETLPFELRIEPAPGALQFMHFHALLPRLIRRRRRGAAVA